MEDETENLRRRIPHARIGGVPTALASERGLLDVMVADCRAFRTGQRRRPTTVFDTNGQAISLYRRHRPYSKAIDAADIVHADGQFIVFLSKLLGRGGIPERTATTDLIRSAAEVAERERLSFYLLGGTEEVNARSADRLRALYPRLSIVGRHHGFYGARSEDEVIEDINSYRPDIVWVGLGKPREQIFCMRNRDRLKCGWLVTSGGCFDFLAGAYERAPAWMQSAGLEWLHRMVTGPAYLKRRYLLTVPHALWLCAYEEARGLVRIRMGPQGH